MGDAIVIGAPDARPRVFAVDAAKAAGSPPAPGWRDGAEISDPPGHERSACDAHRWTDLQAAGEAARPMQQLMPQGRILGAPSLPDCSASGGARVRLRRPASAGSTGMWTIWRVSGAGGA